MNQIDPIGYQQFMKSELIKLRKKNPNINSKDIFKRAAMNWKVSPLNQKGINQLFLF